MQFTELEYGVLKDEFTEEEKPSTTINGLCDGVPISVPEDTRCYACCKAALDDGITEVEYTG